MAVILFFQLGHLTLEDYQMWSVKSALANEFLTLLFQVCVCACVCTVPSKSIGTARTIPLFLQHTENIWFCDEEKKKMDRSSEFRLLFPAIYTEMC